MAQANPQEKALRNRSIIVWGVILALGIASALSVYVFLSAANKTINVMVAGKDIPPYTKITADLLKTEAVQVDTFNLLTASGANVYLTTSDVDGFYTEVPIKQGEMFYKFKVADPKNGRYIAKLYEKPGWKLLTMSASNLSAVGAQLIAGDYIDLYYSNTAVAPPVTTLLLRNVKILDIKYGTNYFQSTPKKNADETAATSDSNAGTGNMNPNLGDNSYIIFAIPNTQAVTITDLILKGQKMYFLGTKPWTVYGQFDPAGDITTTDAATENIIINDLEIPTTDQKSNADAAGVDSLIRLFQDKPLLAAEATGSTPSADTTTSAPVTGDVVYQASVNLPGLFQRDGRPCDFTAFTAAYELYPNAKIKVVYTTGKDLAQPNIKQIKIINLVTVE